MKFSVIVPIYNVEKYLEYCVESILNQSFKDFEIILVNDGSTDNSLSLCEKFQAKDDRVKVINQENKWLSGARNAGIDRAEGEYLLFVDGDDGLMPNALNKINDCINGDSIVAYKYGYIDEDNNLIEDKSVVDFYKNIKTIDDVKKDFLSSDKLGSACIKCMSKKYFNGEIATIRFNEKTRFAEDQIFTCDLLNVANDIIVLDQEIYAYRQRAGSIMKSYNESKIKYVEQYINYIQDTFEVDNLRRKDFEKCLNKRIINACVSEVVLICKLQVCKKEKKNYLKKLTKSPLFKKGKFDYGMKKISLIFVLAKLKLFCTILNLYNIMK